MPSPRLALNTAARDGDFQAARKVVLESPLAAVDLDVVLVCAARRSHVHVMAFLVDSGAADLDSALVQAAMRNQMPACRWLVDAERYVPAADLETARNLAAAAVGATEAEWLMVSERLARKRKRRREERPAARAPYPDRGLPRGLGERVGMSVR